MHDVCKYVMSLLIVDIHVARSCVPLQYFLVEYEVVLLPSVRVHRGKAIIMCICRHKVANLGNLSILVTL